MDEKILKHPKARSILGYNYSMLQTNLMQSQHGHWIEHDLRARSAIERSRGHVDFVPVSTAFLDCKYMPAIDRSFSDCR